MAVPAQDGKRFQPRHASLSTWMHAVETWLSFRYAGHSDRMVVALTEVLLTSVATAGLSLTSSLETAMFGGFMPAVSTALIKWSGNKAAVGSLMTLAAIHGLAATLTIFRRAEARHSRSCPGSGCYPIREDE